MPPEMDFLDPSDVVRILAREIVEGDEKKRHAESNVTQSGGGARDLRFSPSEEFDGLLTRMFPHAEVKRTSRNNPVSGRRESTTVLVRSGALFWFETPPGAAEPNVHQKVAEIWPPYAPRNEFRFSTVHKFTFWDSRPADIGGGRIFVLLVQNRDGKIWVRFASEEGLQHPGWDSDVAEMLRRSLGRLCCTKELTVRVPLSPDSFIPRLQ